MPPTDLLKDHVRVGRKRAGNARLVVVVGVVRFVAVVVLLVLVRHKVDDGCGRVRVDAVAPGRQRAANWSVGLNAYIPLGGAADVPWVGAVLQHGQDARDDLVGKVALELGLCHRANQHSRGR